MLSRERILVKQTVAYDPILVTCHENKQNKTKQKQNCSQLSIVD